MGNRKKKDPSRFDKNAVRRELERDARKRYREALNRLSDEARAARQQRKVALAQQKAECAQGREAALAHADHAYREAKRLAAEARAAHRKHAKTHCDLERSFLRAEKDAKIKDAKERLEAERAYQRSMATIARSNKQRSAERSARTKRSERLSESDDAVRVNLEPHLVALWDQVKKQIRASERLSRTEAFLQYVEEHPQEVWEVQELAVERELAELDARASAGVRPKTKRRRRVQTQFSTPFGAALVEDTARSKQEPLARVRNARRPARRPPPSDRTEDAGDHAHDQAAEAAREGSLAALRSAADEAAAQKVLPHDADRALLSNMLEEPGSFPGSHLAEKRLLHAGFIEHTTGGYPVVTAEGAAFASGRSAPRHNAKASRAGVKATSRADEVPF